MTYICIYWYQVLTHLSQIRKQCKQCKKAMKASYVNFQSHVRQWQSLLFNKSDHICVSRECHPLYNASIASILLNICLLSVSYDISWNERWLSSSKTKHTLHLHPHTGIAIRNNTNFNFMNYIVLFCFGYLSQHKGSMLWIDWCPKGTNLLSWNNP